MAISVPATPSRHEDSVPRLAARDIPPMPKANATKALAEKLAGSGFSRVAAASLARAAVDPADVRRRLDRPAPIRVPGAVLWTVDADVWTPAVVPYIVNYREADGRLFPTDETVRDAAAPPYPPIRRATGDSSGKPILDLELKSRAHLIHAVEASIGYLVEHNPLNESIAEKGVMFPVTLAATLVKTGNDEAVSIPTTVDGSSRISGALDVLGIEPEDALGPLHSNPRELASLIGRIRSIFDRPLEQVSEEELGKANALILPARVIVDFEPDISGSADFAKAIHNYVDLIHGDLPPTPWPDTARIDAKADSVVAELEQANVVTPNKARFLEGMLSPGEARRIKLPKMADERGLTILSILSSKESAVHAAIRAGVIQPTERRYVTKGVKAEICAELALRAARGVLTPKEMSGARDVLGNIYTHQALWEQGLQPSGESPGKLLAQALKELKAGSSGGLAIAELAALGGFWLTAKRILREARFFSSENIRDGRKPSAVLSALMEFPWGLRVLARAVEDGREDDVIWQVDDAGNRVKGVTGEFLKADNDWLRGVVVPPGRPGGEVISSGPSVPKLRERLLLKGRKNLEAAVQSLEQRHDEIREIRNGNGEPLVDKKGIPSKITDDLRERLESIRSKLVVYGATWEIVSESDDGSRDVDGGA